MNERRASYIYLINSGLLIVASVTKYILVMRAEKKKRAKIEAWRQENLACIEKTRRRLLEELDKPDFDEEKFWKMYREEMAFLRIVQRQPMY